MPHSSGGGGFHGGYHGSSHSSSHTPRISNTFYPGSFRYVYYVGGSPRYYYSTKPATASLGGTIFSVAMILIFMALSFIMIIFAYNVPERINYQNVSNHTIKINDYANQIDNEEMLYNKLIEFREITGITTEVLTLENNSWHYTYNDFEDYLYNYYLNEYSDEAHWILGYLYKENDWYFIGMQGNDTDSILTNQKAEEYTESIYNYLKDNKSLEESISLTFDKYNSTIMDPSFDYSIFGFIAIWNTVLLIGLIGVIVSYKSNKVKSDCYEVEQNAVEIKCSYCGKMFIESKSMTCPFCKSTNIKDII